MLGVTSVTQPANGTVVVNDDGTITYTPTGAFTGVDTFTYEIDDGHGGTDTATVSVTVSNDGDGNVAPVGVDDTAITTAGEAVSIDVLANDTDGDGDILGVSAFLSGPANGTLSQADPLGPVIYTPAPGFVGTDTFTYEVDDGQGGIDTATVTVTVTGGRDGIVTGTDDGDLIDEDYLGDPDTPPDRIDNDDAIIPGDAPNDDRVVAGGGDDTVQSGEGSDTVEGGDGDDLIDTGKPFADGAIDTDVLPVEDLPAGSPFSQADDPFDGFDEDADPEDDRDSVDGGAGNDTISTGDDRDTVLGGAGNDVIEAGVDDDLVDGGTGDDLITDAQGADTITGGQGDDTIVAGTDTYSDYPDGAFPIPLGFEADPNTGDGRDSVQGNTGNDLIFTGDDADTIDGGADNDTIDAGIDDDLVMGGIGDDSILGGHGSDTLDGGQGDDFIDGSNLAALELTDDVDPSPENDRDSIDGALGNDTLIGGDDDDTLNGGSGNDLLDGGIDEDVLNGGDESDTLLGGQGADLLNGGAGIDDIDGGADRDRIVVDTAADGAGDVVRGGSEGDDFDTLDLSGVGAGNYRLTNVTADDDGPDRDPNGIDGTVEFLDGAGNVTGTMDFFNIEEVIPCFTPGTLIATPQGERLVEELREGDRVITRDNGIQEIRWVGRKDLTPFDLARKPHMKPILIQKGSLGNGLPAHDLLVSPNHRVLVNNDKTALYFEEREVLAAAKHLTGLAGVDEVTALGVSYIHFMFDAHEVVLSNGAWTESFQPGDYSLKGIGTAQRQEILELFPELEHADGIRAYTSARRSLKKHEAQLLTR
ncbi:type I secretion protein [Roseivivax isoporae LMG 25204]|uniref:Type I secretion protein n=1 Tax=Roseivivax isoporae LMG 25204 TaxID=1449351 RepID=X7FCS7_9RHOB|nr:type I secretion protein [Roseivivax isoporae LMG 25204]